MLSPDGDTESFKIQAGVLQGDTLAPLLFILALDYAMRKATINPQETGFTLNNRRSRRHPATTITDADFVDDIALLSDTIEKAQLLLLRVELAAESIGLHVNEKKTEYITYNQDESEIITLTGKHLVEDFKYLASWINTSEKDMNTRIGLAWAAANKMDIGRVTSLEFIPLFFYSPLEVNHEQRGSFFLTFFLSIFLHFARN